MKKLPKLNELVVFNHDDPEATMFRVKGLSPRGVAVIDAEIEDKHPNQSVQWMDVSCTLYPNVAQTKSYNRRINGKNENCSTT